MAAYHVEQDFNDLNFFGMGGMEGEWLEGGAENGRVYDQLPDHDAVSDLNNKDSTSPNSPGSLSIPMPMQHSYSMPVFRTDFSPASPTWSAVPVNQYHGYSFPQVYNVSTNETNHVFPNVWDVPALQLSPAGSSFGTEMFLSEYESDATMIGSAFSNPNLNVPQFLYPHNGSPSWTGQGSASCPESIASFTSFDIVNEEPTIERFDITAMAVNNSDLTLIRSTSSSSLSTIQYQYNPDTNRLGPDTGPGKKNPRGRKGPLKPSARKTTAEMRKLKACQACRTRKIKCDMGAPCKACVNYYKCDLQNHPCRGTQLERLAGVLLSGNIFPKGRSIRSFLGQDFTTGPTTYTIYLELGFGKPLEWSAQLISPQEGSQTFSTNFIHTHVVYPWRANHETKQQERTERELQKHYVFPAVLADTSNLLSAVDKHVEALLDDPTNFSQFPIYRSPLAVLNKIYMYYRNELSDPKSKQLLRQVLKLLILIHVGDCPRITPSTDSQFIIDTHFPGAGVLHKDVIPCFIRSQLGPIFKTLATTLMKEVLTSLELHCLSKNCAHFPLVICTFAVLFMSVESIYYHTAKDSYHAIYDDDSSFLSFSPPPPTSPQALENCTGVKNLLSFYRTCFSGCHKERISASALAAGTNSFGVVENLNNAIERARTYLEEKNNVGSAVGEDITGFFDRLLAKLFLLQV